MIATAPGKLILTGEYAVLDGAPALVIAVDRRVIARKHVGPRGTAPFLLAVAQELAKQRGADDPATRAALEIVVDSTPLFDGTTKLGLGSSAAVTVAATALALADPRDTVPVIDREAIATIAYAAHASAQRARGAGGSGADIAAAVHGGVLAFTARKIDRIAWPRGVTLIPFFTGTSADTARLVEQVAASRAADRVAVDAALTAIAEVSRAACEACTMYDPALAASALLAALGVAARATDQLAVATGIALVPACVHAARAALARFGGTAKTTGAGGGDVAIGVIPATEDRAAAERSLVEAGCQPLGLSVDQTGVDLRPNAQ